MSIIVVIIIAGRQRLDTNVHANTCGDMPLSLEVPGAYSRILATEYPPSSHVLHSRAVMPGEVIMPDRVVLHK